MKTDDLISMLATGDSSVAGPRAGTRYAMAGGLGAIAAGLMMLVLLQLRHDLLQALLLPMFWVKIGFVASLAGASLFAVLRLSRPGASLDGIMLLLTLPVLTIWAIAAYSLIGTGPDERSRLIFGDTWTVCPLLIALLSLPIYPAVFRVMQDMAPTRPSWPSGRGRSAMRSCCRCRWSPTTIRTMIRDRRRCSPRLGRTRTSTACSGT